MLNAEQNTSLTYYVFLAIKEKGGKEESRNRKFNLNFALSLKKCVSLVDFSVSASALTYIFVP